VAVSRRSFLTFGAVAGGAAMCGWSLRQAKANSPALLRPPGGGDEDAFLAACIRCGQCVQACPIDILEVATAEDGLSAGTPFFRPRENSCDLCLGEQRMECIEACPTSALKKHQRREDVRVGVAVIDKSTCFPFNQVTCRACWHACPFPNDAIEFDEMGRPVVIADGCVGCGLCEHVCLTPETSIRIIPRSDFD